MASISTKYLVEGALSSDDLKKTSSGNVDALIHCTKVDLDPLLIATEKGIERMPIFYNTERKA